MSGVPLLFFPSYRELHQSAEVDYHQAHLRGHMRRKHQPVHPW